MSSKNYSPFRYPGGKSCLTTFIADIAEANELVGGEYMELYAGGAGAALNLLFNGTFSRIHVNDYDYAIYCAWYSILNHPRAFCNRIRSTPLTIDEWHRQHRIYKMGRRANEVELGFATFFLNRTNRSGIIYKAGPIGGFNQQGNYTLDVRFNREDLVERVKKIAARRDDIVLTNEDALTILNRLDGGMPPQLFVYMDPPYYHKGQELYLNNYHHENHQNLATCVSRLEGINWLVSYDNVPEVRELYQRFRMSAFDLNYTLQTKRFGSELLVFADHLDLPETITIKSRTTELALMHE